MKISRELKTGIVAILIIAASIWGYNFLKGQNLFNTSPRTYFAEFNNVQSLNTASLPGQPHCRVKSVVAKHINLGLKKS